MRQYETLAKTSLNGLTFHLRVTVKTETVNHTLILSLHFENQPDVLTHDSHTSKFKPMTLWSQGKFPNNRTCITMHYLNVHIKLNKTTIMQQ